jgi:hypothetical protein
MQTTVWHADKAFFVSTIERDSSAAEAHGMRYEETMAWELDTETLCRKPGILYQVDGGIRNHLLLCRALARDGEWKEPAEGEEGG